MKKIISKLSNFFGNRLLVISVIIILIGIVYVFQLFNLQIVNGEYYRQQSEKKLLRNETIEASRGEITDRNGIILAENKQSYNVELYKVKVNDNIRNQVISEVIDILESNSDKIFSTFPISDDLNNFNFSDDESAKKWKQSNNIPQDESFNDVINYYISKYNLKNYDITKAKKMIMVLYEANLNSYSLFNPAIIAKDISQKSVAQVDESKFKLYGVKTISTTVRNYPNGTLAAHIIGYVNKISSSDYTKLKDQGYSYNSVIGADGIEQILEKYLKGTDGTKRVEVDSMGIENSENTVKDAVSGDTVELTLDYRLQKVAEEALQDTINDIKTGKNRVEKSADADAGAVVVLDVTTGEVLAMASYPSFDINNLNENWNSLSNDQLKPLVNRAIAGTYSPGSTFKMLVALAGLDNNEMTVDEKILDLGVYPYAHHPKCWIYEDRGATHGYVDVTKAIKVSCNYYFYEIGRRLGIDKIVEYAKKFGLGQKTGIELKGEQSGKISGDGADQSTWNLGNTLSSAIGQMDNSYTPLQLANYIATLANGGNLNKVSIIKDIIDSQQDNVSLSEIEKYTNEYTGTNFQTQKLNLNSTYVDAVKQGMLSVTSDSGGTAYIVFKNSNIQVAGKTGTSQQTTGSANGIFVGFAPYDNPKIAVVAIIEHGGEGTYTAKVVKPIMEEYFNIENQDQNSSKQQTVSTKNVEY